VTSPGAPSQSAPRPSAGAGAAPVSSATAPCPGTTKLLLSLRSPIFVNAYVARGSPRLDAFATELTALLASYKAQGKGHFDYRVLDGTGDEGRSKAKAEGIVEQPLDAAGGAPGAARTGFIGLSFHYEFESDRIPLLNPAVVDGLEFWINNKVRELRSKTEGRKYGIGVLTGHGEIAIDEPNLVDPGTGKPSIKAIIQQNFPYYDFHGVDLHAGAEPIDPALLGLIVTQPSSDLRDAELAQIDEFVLLGKAVVFFVGAANVARGDPKMHANLSTHGLEHLLAGYGIEERRDLVVEAGPGASAWIDSAAPSGVAHTPLPFVPLVTSEGQRLDASFAPFFRLDGIAFPLASSLVVHREKQPEATLREVARSSPAAVRVGGSDVDLHPLAPWSPTGVSGPTPLAVTAEGTLHGAFDASRKSKARSRVLVVASSQFLANPLARALATDNPTGPARLRPEDEPLRDATRRYAQQNLTAMILVFKNTLDWLTGEDDFVDCRPLTRTK
jgi:hypothetical protein